MESAREEARLFCDELAERGMYADDDGYEAIAA